MTFWQFYIIETIVCIIVSWTATLIVGREDRSTVKYVLAAWTFISMLPLASPLYVAGLVLCCVFDPKGVREDCVSVECF